MPQQQTAEQRQAPASPASRLTPSAPQPAVSAPPPASPAPLPPEAPPAPADSRPAPAAASPPALGKPAAPPETPAPKPGAPAIAAGLRTGEKPSPAAGPRRRPGGKKTAGSTPRKKRRRPSPVPVSMWLVPPLRLPFSTPGEFLRWFVTGLNLWAVGAAALCALLGWLLLGRMAQPRQLGVEQALAGGEGTRGLTYTVEQIGEGQAAVTGSWSEAAGQSPPDPALAAALCAALSPEEIYGHSDRLYRTIAGQFFGGEDFTLTVTLREAPGEKGEEPEPLFTVTRAPGEEDWPRPDCDAAFARQWRESYDSYWLFGQGRREEMGPPQSDPILEEGDLPPEGPGGESSGEEAPPLPDLEGADSSASPEEPGEDPGSSPADPEEPGGPSAGEPGPASSASGSSSGGEEEVPEDFLAKLLACAARFRGLGWEEAWALFWAKE